MGELEEQQRHRERAHRGAGAGSNAPDAMPRQRLHGTARPGGQAIEPAAGGGSGFCSAINAGLCPSVRGSGGARSVLRALGDADTTQAAAILAALRDAQSHAPCDAVDTPIGVELQNRTVTVSGTELPGLVEAARARARQYGGTGGDAPRDVVAGEGNAPGACTPVPGDNVPLPAQAAQAREALHTEIAGLEEASTALITHLYDYLQNNWTAYLGYTQQQREMPWQRGQIAEFIRGKLGGWAEAGGEAAGEAAGHALGHALEATGTALGTLIPVPMVGSLLGWLGGRLAGQGAEWLIDHATGREHDDNDYRPRDAQIAQAAATTRQATQLAGGRDAEVAQATRHIADAYRGPLGQMVNPADFNRLHSAVQQEHRALATRAASVRPTDRDLCQQMVRAWTAGMAVGAHGHRREVDDPSFARARDYSWNQSSFENQTDLFIYQIQARCAQHRLDADAWLADLRYVVGQQGTAPAERVLEAVRSHLRRTVTGPRGDTNVYAAVEVSDGALTLNFMNISHGPSPLQDNTGWGDGDQ